IERSAKVDLPNHEASVTFRAITHEKVVYGPITIEGLSKEIPEGMVRRALMLKEGQRYSQRNIVDAQHAVLALGVFSSVQIEPQLSEGGPTETVPIVVRV